jgi:hypothetical protein
MAIRIEEAMTSAECLAVGYSGDDPFVKSWREELFLQSIDLAGSRPHSTPSPRSSRTSTPTNWSRPTAKPA